MPFAPHTLIRVKRDVFNPIDTSTVYKRVDEVKIHFDWALTHNLNWRLILCDHWIDFAGILVTLRYAGGLPITMSLGQRIAVPTPTDGYHWQHAGKLQIGHEVWTLTPEFDLVRTRIVEMDRAFHQGLLWTLTIEGEHSFVAYDLLCHRNPRPLDPGVMVRPERALAL